MDFQLNEEQVDLQSGVNGFCEKRFDGEQLRLLNTQGGFDRQLWQEVAELGVFALNVGQERGGLGLGCVEAAVCLEEMGRRLLPGPLIWSLLLADSLEGVAQGKIVVGGLDLIGSVSTPLMIEHLENIDTLIILKPDGVFQLDPKNLTALPIENPLDPFTPVHHIESLPSLEALADQETSHRLWWRGAALAAAQLLGIAEETLLMANEFAKQREQFNRPIGQFQAIKHMLADMFVRVEVARAATFAAAATLDDPQVGNLQRAISSAKLTAGEAAMKNAQACIQIHGGMGYTWEIPAHYYLKRTWLLEGLFGDGSEHADRIADSLSAEID